jgi:MFS family permease
MFLLAGAVLGSGLGGVQVADRVLMMRLSPPEKLGEFFGLYGLVGKGSQVIGQLLFGVILLVFQPILGVAAYQIAVLSLLVTMLIGAWLIRPVSDRWSGSGELAIEDPAGAAGAGDRAARAEVGGLSPRSRPGGAAARPTSSRSSPRGSIVPDASPAPRPRDRSPRPGSPGRRRGGVLRSTGIGIPTTCSAASITSRTLKPPPLPRLQTSGSSVRGSPGAVASSARRWASARSATSM